MFTCLELATAEGRMWPPGRQLPIYALDQWCSTLFISRSIVDLAFDPRATICPFTVASRTQNLVPQERSQPRPKLIKTKSTFSRRPLVKNHCSKLKKLNLSWLSTSTAIFFQHQITLPKQYSYKHGCREQCTVQACINVLGVRI